METTSITTPRAQIDLDILQRNARDMAQRCTRLGVKLRPHVKTHKTVEGARLQVAGHFGGITVSTLEEARFFAEAGFEDMTYAVPVAPGRLEQAAELVREKTQIHLLLDSQATLAAARKVAVGSGIRFSFFLKVDCGYGRAGVIPGEATSFALVEEMVAAPEIDFRGLLTHGGHSYSCRNPEEISKVAEQERSAVVGFARALRQRGFLVPEVSLGSTPTLSVVGEEETAAGSMGRPWSEVTEARPGNYLFYDMFQAAIGSCTVEQIAFSVLATVIGSYPSRGELLLDAGSTALSRDPGPTHVDASCGFGLLVHAVTGEIESGLSLVSLSQEHGCVQARPGTDVGAYPIGSQLRILPNHSCLAAACFEEYQVLSGGLEVDRWKPVGGW